MIDSEMAHEQVILTVRVQPGAQRDELVGWQDDILRIRLRAAPERGRANEALCRFLAECLDLPTTNLAIVTGATSRLKRLRVSGLTASELRRRLSGS
jgi:uncharacterized protein (TIGR00251 family)